MLSLPLNAEAAVLKTLTERAKSRVYLLTDQLDALCRFKALKDAVDLWREAWRGYGKADGGG